MSNSQSYDPWEELVPPSISRTHSQVYSAPSEKISISASTSGDISDSDFRWNAKMRSTNVMESASISPRQSHTVPSFSASERRVGDRTFLSKSLEGNFFEKGIPVEKSQSATYAYNLDTSLSRSIDTTLGVSYSHEYGGLTMSKSSSSFDADYLPNEKSFPVETRSQSRAAPLPVLDSIVGVGTFQGSGGGGGGGLHTNQHRLSSQLSMSGSSSIHRQSSHSVHTRDSTTSVHSTSTVRSRSPLTPHSSMGLVMGMVDKLSPTPARSGKDDRYYLYDGGESNDDDNTASSGSNLRFDGSFHTSYPSPGSIFSVDAIKKTGTVDSSPFSPFSPFYFDSEASHMTSSPMYLTSMGGSRGSTTTTAMVGLEKELHERYGLGSGGGSHAMNKLMHPPLPRAMQPPRSSNLPADTSSTYPLIASDQDYSYLSGTDKSPYRGN